MVNNDLNDLNYMTLSANAEFNNSTYPVVYKFKCPLGLLNNLACFTTRNWKLTLAH